MDQPLKRHHAGSLLSIVAIALKMCIIFVYFDNSGDKTLQTAAAINISKGAGYTLNFVDPAHLDSSYQKPMTLWPPAYAATVGVLIRAGIAPLKSTLIIDLVQGALFVLLIYWITQLLGFPFWLSMFFVYFKALEINEAIIDSWPSDYFSLNNTLLSICCFLQFLQNRKTGLMWLCIVFNAFSPWIRYANIPLVFVLPLIIIFLGYREKNKVFTKTGAIALIAGFTSICTLFWYNYSRSGMIMFSTGFEKGIYLTNLLHLPPIFWMCMINVKFLQVQLSLRSGLSYELVHTILQLTSTIILILLIVDIKRRWREYAINHRSLFFLWIAGATAITGVLMLAWLSITNNSLHNYDHWTFIEEERYMLLITLVISIYLFLRYVVRHKGFLTLPIILIMLADMLHGIWVIGTKLDHSRELSYLRQSPQTVSFFQAIRAKAKKDDMVLVVADYRYSLAGFSGIQDINLIPDMKFDPVSFTKASRKYRILYRIDIGHEVRFPELLSQPGITSLGIVNFNHFYSLDIVPGARP